MNLVSRNTVKMEMINQEQEKPYKVCEIYIDDAPNPRDMELIQKNLEHILKVQEDYWKWKNQQEGFE